MAWTERRIVFCLTIAERPYHLASDGHYTRASDENEEKVEKKMEGSQNLSSKARHAPYGGLFPLVFISLRNTPGALEPGSESQL
jgi:hypothetical protein